MLSKRVGWKGVVIISVICIPLGYLMTGSTNQNLVAVGEILKLVGMISLIFGIGNGIVGIFKKGAEAIGPMNDPGSPIRKAGALGKNFLLFLAVWLVCIFIISRFSEDGFINIVIGLALAGIVTFLYLDKKKNQEYH